MASPQGTHSSPRKSATSRAPASSAVAQSCSSSTTSSTTSAPAGTEMASSTTTSANLKEVLMAWHFTCKHDELQRSWRLHISFFAGQKKARMGSLKKKKTIDASTKIRHSLKKSRRKSGSQVLSVSIEECVQSRGAASC